MDAQSSGTLQSSTSHTDDSSKSTGSKKSGTDSVQQDKERDLMKDNAASPIDLECLIQEERITKIIDEAVYKTKLAICLPKLVQNYRILSTRLTPQHMDDLIFIFEQYDNPLFSASLLNIAALEDIKNGDVSLKNRLNPELGHLLYILNSYPSLKPHVEEMVQKMKEDYISQDDADRAPVPTLEYLLAFERFRDMMVKQMQMSAAEELAEKLYIRKMEESNAKLLAKIAEYEEQIDTNQKRFEAVMAGKQAIIAELEQELGLLNAAAQAKLKKKVLDSDRQMVLMHRSHTVRNEMLKEEEVETREGYHKMLHHHLIDEKAQRARRFKVETQLLSWLAKYDTEMADKQKELDELERMFKEESKKVEDLSAKLAEQDIEYLPLMQEREEEYHAEMKAKMKALQIEHAARVIQNSWRQVLANRQEKRKLKKLWAKKKAEIEKQEKLEELRQRKEAAAAKKAAALAKKEAKEAKKRK